MSGNALPIVLLAAGAFFLMRKGEEEHSLPEPGTVKEVTTEGQLKAFDAYWKQKVEQGSGRTALMVHNMREDSVFDEVVAGAFSTLAASNPEVEFYAARAGIAKDLNLPTLVDLDTLLDSDIAMFAYIDIANKYAGMVYVVNTQRAPAEYLELVRKLVAESKANTGPISINARLMEVGQSVSSEAVAAEVSKVFLEPLNTAWGAGAGGTGGAMPTILPSNTLSMLLG